MKSADIPDEVDVAMSVRPNLSRVPGRNAALTERIVVPGARAGHPGPPGSGPAVPGHGVQCTYDAYTDSVVVPLLPLPKAVDAPSQNVSALEYQAVLPSP